MAGMKLKLWFDLDFSLSRHQGRTLLGENPQSHNWVSTDGPTVFEVRAGAALTEGCRCLAWCSDAVMIKHAQLLNINREESKGRYLTAKRDLEVGELIIEEEAYSILITDENESKFCNFCFEILAESAVRCLGCSKATYCGAECRRLAWRAHHWFECCIHDIKIGAEVRTALRTLLAAAFSIFSEEQTDCSSLHLVAESLSCPQGKQNRDVAGGDSDGNGGIYEGNYWNIYCLQTHAARAEVRQRASFIIQDIACLTHFILSCFSFSNTLHKELGDNDFGKSCEVLSGGNLQNTLLHSVFKKLSFVSYYSMPNFNIELWRQHMFMCHTTCKRSKGKTFEDIYRQAPATEESLCLNLLLHHAMQFQTNSQAIFKVHDVFSNELNRSPVEMLSQIRVATGFFPTTSLMNHGCSPNTTVSFTGKEIKVVTSRRIRKGEEVLHCYGPHHCSYTVEERRRLLQNQYYFTCNCEACVSESSDDEATSFKLQFHAFKCTSCEDPVEAGPEGTSATCINTECRKQQDITSAGKTYAHAKEIFVKGCELMDSGRVVRSLHLFKECLKNMESVLYLRHIDIGKVHDRIAQCYVIEEEYKSAIPHLCNSITTVGMLHGAQSVELVHELQKLASVYFNCKKVAEAAKTAKKALSIYEIIYPDPACFPPGVEEMRQIIRFCG